MTGSTSSTQSLGTPVDQVAVYFRAWTDHDASALARVFSEGATYQDPIVPGPLSAEAAVGYAQALWAAFPDLAFVQDHATAQGDRVVVPWRMTGTNTGPFPGLPGPTGAALDLPGIDVITVGDDGITGVVGYFDQLTMFGQLGVPVQIGGAS